MESGLSTSIDFAAAALRHFSLRHFYKAGMCGVSLFKREELWRESQHGWVAGSVSDAEGMQKDLPQVCGEAIADRDALLQKSGIMVFLKLYM